MRATDYVLICVFIYLFFRKIVFTKVIR